MCSRWRGSSARPSRTFTRRRRSRVCLSRGWWLAAGVGPAATVCFWIHAGAGGRGGGAAVVYGATGEASGREATPIAVDPRSLLKILHSDSGANTLISLKLAGTGDTRVLIKEFQLDPVTHHVLHADFYRVRMDRVIQVTIPVTVKGEAKGVKQQAGVLEFVHREIEVECLPADIPEHVEIDVSELMLHQGVRVRDIIVGPKWKPLWGADRLLVLVILQ